MGPPIRTGALTAVNAVPCRLIDTDCLNCRQSRHITIEMSNIENMRRRPSVESVTYVRRDSLLASQLEHIQKLFF